MVELVFDLTGHEAKLSALENLPTRVGWLELNLLELESFQREEHLVFTALTDDHKILDQELCELLFRLSAHTAVSDAAPSELDDQLAATVKRQLDATLSRVLEENNQYFLHERNKLEAWAEDQIFSAEQQLADTKVKLKETKRQTRLAATLEEQKTAQEELKQLEKRQRRQRQEIFDVEDQIEAKRDELIEALEQQMHQRSTSCHLFRIRWKLV